MEEDKGRLFKVSKPLKSRVCFLILLGFICLCPSLEKAMAPHSSTLAWKIPWMLAPGRLQSMGSLRVGHDWGTSLSLSCIGKGNGNPLQGSCLENPRHREAWWASVYGVAQNRTRLKRLSSSSSIYFNGVLRKKRENETCLNLPY